MESRIYPVMSDIPALSDLITSMVASGYDYRRDDDAGLWSSADLTYVITYEMRGRYACTKSSNAGERGRDHTVGL